MIELLNIDCIEFMKTCADNEFDLAICDPPYGLGIDGQKLNNTNKNPKHNRKAHDFKGWDNAIPNEEYFKELFRVSKNQIIWGGNYFTEYLKPTKAWIFWYKGQNDLTMSDGEMAWTSFSSSAKKYDFNAAANNDRIHPTQKPVGLYGWILSKYAKPDFKLLDTHFGSGSIALAVDEANGLDKMNLHLTACEIDKEYIVKAIKRISESLKQGTLSF